MSLRASGIPTLSTLTVPLWALFSSSGRWANESMHSVLPLALRSSLTLCCLLLFLTHPELNPISDLPEGSPHRSSHGWFLFTLQASLNYHPSPYNHTFLGQTISSSFSRKLKFVFLFWSTVFTKFATLWNYLVYLFTHWFRTHSVRTHLTPYVKLYPMSPRFPFPALFFFLALTAYHLIYFLL